VQPIVARILRGMPKAFEPMIQFNSREDAEMWLP